MEDENELIRSGLIRQLLEAMIKDLDGELNLSRLPPSQVAALVQALDHTALQGVFKILPGGYSGSSKIVVCAMPNNRQVVARSASIQCQNPSCSEYFCKKHVIVQCPLCGGSLQ